MKSGFEDILPFVQQFTAHVRIPLPWGAAHPWMLTQHDRVAFALPPQVRTDVVIKTALSIRITTKQLAALEHEFHQAEDAAEAAFKEVSQLLNGELAVRGRALSTLSDVDTGKGDWTDVCADKPSSDTDDDPFVTSLGSSHHGADSFDSQALAPVLGATSHGHSHTVATLASVVSGEPLTDDDQSSTFRGDASTRSYATADHDDAGARPADGTALMHPVTCGNVGGGGGDAADASDADGAGSGAAPSTPRSGSQAAAAPAARPVARASPTSADGDGGAAKAPKAATATADSRTRAHVDGELAVAPVSPTEVPLVVRAGVGTAQ